MKRYVRAICSDVTATAASSTATLHAALSVALPAHEPLDYAYSDIDIPVLPGRVRPVKRIVAKPSAAVGDVVASSGAVVYWMYRDCRVADNWALTYAAQRARAANAPLVVVYCLPYANDSVECCEMPLRAVGFALRGLRVVEEDLSHLHIPFRVLLGDPCVQVAGYVNAIGARALVADFLPLREPTRWKLGVAAALSPSVESFVEVDAHNIVPAWIASSKQEVGARTLRGKIHSSLPTYMTSFPRMSQQLPSLCAKVLTAEEALSSRNVDIKGPGAGTIVHLAKQLSAAPGAADSMPALTDWPALIDDIKINMTVPEVTWAVPGEYGARDALLAFLGSSRLTKYAERRNNPTLADGTSCLSPWLHAGHLSAQRVMLELSRVSGVGLRGLFPDTDRVTGPAVFAEELVVRRELADNFCLYAPQYDSLVAAAAWARESLAKHASDPREASYTLEQFEAGATHEALWNACQMELVHTGKLHGFCRMYWAKKVLEWSASPEEALRIVITLNDRYSIDGFDPNGTLLAQSLCCT